ncbi:hypothetical protein [Streptomyces griseosporeus]|uniref:hypothetical protein n=1 Tax=Streptomyces griseosporeus TaxID=1910 RepID=UPI0036F81054
MGVGAGGDAVGGAGEGVVSGGAGVADAEGAVPARSAERDGAGSAEGSVALGVVLVSVGDAASSAVVCSARPSAPGVSPDGEEEKAKPAIRAAAETAPRAPAATATPRARRPVARRWARRRSARPPRGRGGSGGCIRGSWAVAS